MKTYGKTAMTFHWLMFLLMSGSFTVGFYMADLPLSPLKLKLYSWHKWAGVTLFMLVLLRLIWRQLHPPPVLPASMPLWQQRAAELTHFALYVLMIVMPLSGWLMSSAKGFTTVWFGVLPLPNLLQKNPPLGEALAEVHGAIGLIILAVVALHVLAALKHHFVDRDEVLARMLPGLKIKS